MVRGMNDWGLVGVNILEVAPAYDHGHQSRRRSPRLRPHGLLGARTLAKGPEVTPVPAGPPWVPLFAH